NPAQVNSSFRFASLWASQVYPGSITGRAYVDANRDGRWQPGEAAMAGLTMYIDLDNDGILDDGERTAVADSDGNYAFPHLAPGTYVVRPYYGSKSDWTGWQWTQPGPTTDWHFAPVVSGQTLAGQDFGLRQEGAITVRLSSGLWRWTS